jgi:rhamnopyranosyl-N-acetylglucosaminyl-diphospho-decaprenol beta-1,3/1,4-galactofuranosyltransferase
MRIGGPARIAAIVVTYDRPDSLRECLDALKRQSRPLDRIYVIDNHAGRLSGPATPAVHLGRSSMTYLAPAENLGGAGGFSLGIEHAYADGFDWFWLMDDDVIPDNAALEALVIAHERMPSTGKPVLLASLVTWTDGRPHLRNGVIYRRDSDRRRAAAVKALGYAGIRACTFVSALIARRAVATSGYPIADYFINGDDLEYTSRILRQEQGLLVPTSIVCHRTTHNDTRPDSAGRRFFFARNFLWMLLYSRALSLREKFALTALYAIPFVNFLLQQRGRPSSWLCIAQGFAAALTRRPTPAPRPPTLGHETSRALHPDTRAQTIAD